MSETEYKQFRAKQAEERRQEWVRQCRWQDAEIVINWRLEWAPGSEPKRFKFLRKPNVGRA